MKRIVICCDGTWKRVDARHPTNVVKLAQAALPEAPDGVAQVVLHLDGVGSGRGVGRVTQGVDRLLGGAFGMGLMATLEAAYRFLILNHASGDEIYLFGFSRGAFSARSLAGLIRNCGILRRENTRLIPEALELYRNRRPQTHPDSSNGRAFRDRYACATPGRTSAGIRYLGVWDTVGALGVPGYLALASRINRGLRFHDTRLSGSVEAARHAVALDERRAVFPPALWDNLDQLNARYPDETRYHQCWFPGDHASVGGGGDVTALSSGAALWIAEGAMEAGLGMDPAVLATLEGERDWLGPLHAAQGRGLVDAMLGWPQAEREGPARPEYLAGAVLERWRGDPSYRPGPLRRLGHAIEAAAERLP